MRINNLKSIKKINKDTEVEIYFLRKLLNCVYIVGYSLDQEFLSIIDRLTARKP